MSCDIHLKTNIMNQKNQNGRKSSRQKGHDYSRAAIYFVTVCTQARICLFGEIIKNKMRLNTAGTMVAEQWLGLPDRFPNIILDEYVVMPNHLHGIIKVMCSARYSNDNGTETRVTLGKIIGAFKSITTVMYIKGARRFGWIPFENKLWQRNYHERNILSVFQLNKFRQYIRLNPSNWMVDIIS